LIQSHVEEPDPTRRVEQGFASRYPLITELHPPGISIKGFARQYLLDKLPPGVVPVDIHFENGLRLVGYETSPVTPARDELFHPPSAWLHVTLYWTSDQPILASATPFVHLVGPEGIWGASLERSGDALKLFPPTLWSGGHKSTTANPIVRHDLDINLNPATPAGTYQLVVGLPGETVEYALTQIRVR
jgi:hypothetical protein